MTTQEKNIAIAEMLECFVRNPSKNLGEILVEIPKQYDFYCEGYGYTQRPKAEKYKVISLSGEKIVTNFTQWTNAKNLKFHSDANWQFEAIEFIEKYSLEQNYSVEIIQNMCTVYCNSKESEELFTIIRNTKKEAIFEAIYQFSQYLKEKQ